MDPVNGSPQAWAKSCFYMCVYAVMFQTIVSIAHPIMMGGTVKKGSTEGDMVYEVSNKPSGMCLTACQYITMLSIYIGFTAVVVSIFTLELRTAPSTPCRSPRLCSAC